MSPQLIDAPTRATTRGGGRARRAAPRAGARPRSSAATWARRRYWRRRAVVLVSLLALAFLATGLVGRVGAEAELEDKVAGHVVVQPGDTLWDAAVATAPAGTDTREHLAAIRELNGIDGSHVDAWTVVLIPAR